MILVGFAAAAGHLVILVAMVSAGTVLVAVISDNFTDIVNAQAQAIQRIREARSEEIDLKSEFFDSNNDVVMANWTNNGSEEIRFEDLTLLVGGNFKDKDTVSVFQVRGATSSEVWLPGEVLEVEVSGEGNADLALVAPHGTADYRRA